MSKGLWIDADKYEFQATMEGDERGYAGENGSPNSYQVAPPSGGGWWLVSTHTDEKGEIKAVWAREKGTT